jgi:hypothetical protein
MSRKKKVVAKSKDHLIPHSKSYSRRKHDTRNLYKRFLIICEGTKLEPQYFKHFKHPGVKIKIIGTGKNTESLVDEAVKRKKDDIFDQVWCVFDKDDFPEDQFENAIKQAERKGLNVAYSNQSFELWYVLHFEYLHTSIDRKYYIEKLEHYLNIKYTKNDPEIFSRLQKNITTAINNAEKLLMEYTDSHPEKDDPSTTVHKLVLELLRDKKNKS